MKKCSFCGSEKYYAKGYCKNCYQRYLKHGNAEYVQRILIPHTLRKCDFCGEEKKHYSKGLCRSCYNRYLRRETAEYWKPKVLTEEEKEQKRLHRIEKSKQYREEHKEQVKEKWKKYYSKNKEKEKERKAKWYQKNKEEIYIRQKMRWIKKHSNEEV